MACVGVLVAMTLVTFMMRFVTTPRAVELEPIALEPTRPNEAACYALQRSDFLFEEVLRGDVQRLPETDVAFSIIAAQEVAESWAITSDLAQENVTTVSEQELLQYEQLEVDWAKYVDDLMIAEPTDPPPVPPDPPRDFATPKC